MKRKTDLHTIGIIGLGLMGQGIASCLIGNGFHVVAYSRTASREEETLTHIGSSISKLLERNLLSAPETVKWEDRFSYVNSLEKMDDCQFVIETVGESLELKREIYHKIESVVGKNVVIATNTSGISVSLLQEGLQNQERFIGMHWAEPAEITRYLELSPGQATADYAMEAGRLLGEGCGKHPTILNFDIPGLISNRLMYAIIREAIHMVEMGVADIETIDRSFRNDIGWWSALCGPFRWMDLTGLPTYAKVIEGLFPDLSNDVKLPELMKEKVATKTKFYDYQGKMEEEWENMWTEFTHDVNELVGKYEKKANL